MAEKKHPLMLEAIKKANEVATCNRGAYPFTKAANVFTEAGASLEPVTPDPDPPVTPTYTAAAGSEYFSDTELSVKVGELEKDTAAEPVEGEEYFTVTVSDQTYYVSGDDVTEDE